MITRRRGTFMFIAAVLSILLSSSLSSAQDGHDAPADVSEAQGLNSSSGNSTVNATEAQRIAKEQDAAERRKFREEMAARKEAEERERDLALCKLQVTYGSVIQLQHVPTKRFLSATNFKYFHPSSSGQHQVIAVDQQDGYTHWRVMPRSGQRWELVKDVPVKNGEVIRLLNLRTSRNLHSHDGPISPLSKQREVSNFGEEYGSIDSNDNWVVKTQDEFWYMTKPVELKHAPTKSPLISSDDFDNKNYTFGFQEVACKVDQRHASSSI
eukprot:754334-Hanusia_phi.AAC.1